MKITKKQLKQIIQEELKQTLNEGYFGDDVVVKRGDFLEITISYDYKDITLNNVLGVGEDPYSNELGEYQDSKYLVRVVQVAT